jgi:peptide deformylase
VVLGLTEKGKKAELGLKGLMARVIQHEIDHLDGKLIIDYQTNSPATVSDRNSQEGKDHADQNTF